MGLAAMAFSIISAGMAASAWAYAEYQVRHQADIIASLREAMRMAAPAAPPVNPLAAQQAATLEQFNSHQFTAQFHQTAAGVSLPLDEVAYSLEEGDKLPYLRYRVTTTVKARYLDVRKFIAALASDMPHVALDSIRCVRETGAAQPLSCDLAFSAFFLKA